MNQYGLKPTGTSSLIDQLSYHYMAQSNKLLNVVDQANDANSTLGDFKYDPNITKTENTVDYTYDGNGNMISDQNKKINNIVYNILNLPSQITIPSKGIIRYYYDATGSKLQKRTLDNTISPGRTTVTNYIGGAVYQNDTLQFFGTLEGRVRANEASTGWLYDYFLKDHLGNTRMMITDDYNVASPILEAYSYYPFGLQQKGIGLTKDMNDIHNRYTYNGKELQEDLGLDQYDYGARFYDAQIGVWHTQDPLSEVSRRWTPYNYAYDNPLRFIDKDGMIADTPIIQKTILQFDNVRGNKVEFNKFLQGSQSVVIANQSDADIDGDGSNSAEAQNDRTHQNTNAAGIDPDNVNGYVLPTSNYKALKNGHSVKNEKTTATGKANRKAFASNGVKHKDVALMYNIENDKSAFGIYVEGGPNNKSGEITPAAAAQLGIDPDPNRGGMDPNHLLLIVFPGSSKDFGGKAPTQDMINRVGGKYYQQNKELINDAVNAAKGTPTINSYD
jgi:RHS repeat-associated protein